MFNALLQSGRVHGIFLVTFSGIFASIFALLGVGGASNEGQHLPGSRLAVQQEAITRVPVQPQLQALEWDEHKGPKCIPADQIRAAKLTGPRQVDFLLKNRSRVRAKFDEDCPTLDFYGGLYLDRSDERLCAKRDLIRSRVGGSCRIEKFRMVTPKVKR